MKYIYDSYELKYSPVITIIGSEENTTSLELQEAPILPLQLSGFVYNTTLGGTVVANAFVSVYDMTDHLVASAYTDDSGYYSITTLTDGEYQVATSKNRFMTTDPIHITLGADPVEQHLLLQPYTSADRVIYGVVFGNAGPVNGARINVIDRTGKIVASTLSIDDGEYSAPNLQNGTYTIVVSAAGYSADSVSNIIISDETPLIGKNITLTAYTPPVDGATISGFITSVAGPIANAWVGLYCDCDTIIDTTVTTSEGYYIFSDVTPGYYVVKAKALA